MVKDLEKIKKVYGEDFAHLCRSLFPTLLEKEGLLFQLISDSFAPSHNLYKDLSKNTVFLKNFVYSKLPNDIANNRKNPLDESPQQLLKKAGYNLYECKTQDEILAFKKYYARGEELCTFRDQRLNTARVFFIVKDNADKFKRDNFTHPKREDDYSTSVLSIQFTKTNPSYVSIKSRYNHIVDNPDATYGNDLDSIYPGLQKAFIDYYKIPLDTKLTNGLYPPGNFVADNTGKLYRCNLSFQASGLHFCENNVIIDAHGNARKLEPSRYILADQYIIDMKNKKIDNGLFELYEDYNFQRLDSFNKHEQDIKDIIVSKNRKGEKIIQLVHNGYSSYITLNSSNQMIKYTNNKIEKIDDGYLYFNYALQELNLQNTKSVGKDFLAENSDLKTLSMPSLEHADDGFLYSNLDLETINLPNLKTLGNNSFTYNAGIKNISIPSAIVVGDNCFERVKKLDKLDAKKLEKVGDAFLFACTEIKDGNLDNLQNADDDCFYSLLALNNLKFDSLISCGSNFLNRCMNETTVSFKNLEKCGHNFMSSCIRLAYLDVPKLRKASRGFLEHCGDFRKLNAPNLREFDESHSFITNPNRRAIIEEIKRNQKKLAKQDKKESKEEEKKLFANLLNRWRRER